MKKTNLIVSILAVSALFIFTEIAQASWIKSYSSGYWIQGRSTIISADGGFLIAGALPFNIDPMNGALIVKLNSSGNLEWSRQYGDNNWWQFYKILKKNDQEYIVTGSEKNGGLIVQVNSNGEILSSRVFLETNSIINIAQTSDGGYIALGYKATAIPDYRSYIALKLDSNFNIVWRTEIPISTRYDAEYPIYETIDRGYIFSCDSYGGSPWIVKLKSNGDVDWQKKYETNSYWSNVRSIYPTRDGGYIASGLLHKYYGVQSSCFLVFKIDANGNKIWSRIFDTEGNEWAESAIETTTGEVMVVGTDYSNDAPNARILLLKLSSSGDLISAKRYGHGISQGINSGTQTTAPLLIDQENIVVTGYNRPDVEADPFHHDLLLMRLSYSGLVGDNCDFISDVNITQEDVEFEIIDTTVEPDRIVYESVDTDLNWNSVNFNSAVICEGAPVINPIIAQTPISGPPGTTFMQWGTGFTPNSAAIMHVQKPDGTQYPEQNIPIDGTGNFEIEYTVPMDREPGTYTWWMVDGPTGIKSNEVSYEVTEPLPLEVTLTVALDPQKAGQIRSISDSGIRCGGKCENVYSLDSQVKIKEDPKKGWKFDHWDHEFACSFENPTTITMDSDKFITARFVLMNDCDKRYSGPGDCVNWVRYCTDAGKWLPPGLLTLKNKTDEIDNDIAEQGSVAVIDIGGKYAKYGHVAYVKYVFGSKITIEEAAYKVGVITTRTGTEEELKIVGYIKEE